MVARFLNDLIDAGIVVVGVVMKQDQFFGAAFHHDVYGLAPVAVSPAALAGFVFFRKILRVVDEQVGAGGELAHILIEQRVAGLVVGGIDHHAFFGLEAVAHAAL